MRHDLAVSQVLGGVIGTSFATDAQANAALDPLFQRREIQVAWFKPADFASKVQPSDEQLQAYYKAHPDQFLQAEQAAVEYVVLDIDSLLAGMVLNEDDLRTYYKENAARMAGKEERRASHILITAAKDAPAAARKAARAPRNCWSRRAKPLGPLPNWPGRIPRTGFGHARGDLGFFAGVPWSSPSKMRHTP